MHAVITDYDGGGSYDHAHRMVRQCMASELRPCMVCFFCIVFNLFCRWLFGCGLLIFGCSVTGLTVSTRCRHWQDEGFIGSRPLPSASSFTSFTSTITCSEWLRSCRRVERYHVKPEAAATPPESDCHSTVVRARNKRRGFSPGADAQHSHSARAHRTNTTGKHTFLFGLSLESKEKKRRAGRKNQRWPRALQFSQAR